MRISLLVHRFAAALIACAAGASAAAAAPLINELKLGILDHDVPDLWSGFRAEPNSVDINIEAILSPSVMFMGGTIRPAVGGTINTEGATSHAYIDARWQYETPSGIFFGLGVGGAIHNGQLQLEDWDRKALGSRVGLRAVLYLGFSERRDSAQYLGFLPRWDCRDFRRAATLKGEALRGWRAS